MITPASIGFNVPFQEAIDFMEGRGVVLPERYYGEMQDLYRTLNFSIAGVASLDQLQAVLDSLTAKLADGQSFHDWQKEVSVQDLGLPKHRLDNIFRTNIQSAYNRGRWGQQVENKKAQPYLMYDAINDSRTRASHAALDGIIRPVGDPFWNSHYPPNGYRCRCHCISLTEKQAQTRSKDTAGEDEAIQKNGLNKPVEPDKMKPDKGWDYHVGSDLTAGIDKAVADRKANHNVEPKLKAALIANLAGAAKVVKSADKKIAGNSMTTEIIKQFVNGEIKRDKIVASVLSDETKRLINADTSNLLLSKETLDAHLKSHPDITAKDYALIPEIVEKGELYPQGNKRYALLHKDGKLYRAAIKTTADGKEAYFLSLLQQLKNWLIFRLGISLIGCARCKKDSNPNYLISALLQRISQLDSHGARYDY